MTTQTKLKRKVTLAHILAAHATGISRVIVVLFSFRQIHWAPDGARTFLELDVRTPSGGEGLPNILCRGDFEVRVSSQPVSHCGLVGPIAGYKNLEIRQYK